MNRNWMMLFPLLATLVSCSSAPTTSEQPLTVDEIRQVLLLNIPKFRACYDDILAQGDTSDRTVELQFTIGPTGRVSKSRTILLSGKKLTPKLESCLNNVIYKAEFAKPANGGTVEVKQPMNFYPKDMSY